ncbi:MAG: hypothetical protein ACO3VG_04335, partial [Nitriliruptoraceae bacterium]
MRSFDGERPAGGPGRTPSDLDRLGADLAALRASVAERLDRLVADTTAGGACGGPAEALGPGSPLPRVPVVSPVASAPTDVAVSSAPRAGARSIRVVSIGAVARIVDRLRAIGSAGASVVVAAAHLIRGSVGALSAAAGGAVGTVIRAAAAMVTRGAGAASEAAIDARRRVRAAVRAVAA